MDAHELVQNNTLLVKSSNNCLKTWPHEYVETRAPTLLVCTDLRGDVLSWATLQLGLI